MEPLVVIVGETASGKSALAMELAQRFNGEIISADSWQVYKGFDIGSSKPSKREQKQIKHHLLDVANPKRGFSAAQFKKLAVKAMEDVSGRGKLAILVGGTGLYVDSIIFNYGFLPAGSARQRQKLNALGLDELKLRVKDLNLDTTGIDIQNKRRLVRLLEVSGKRPEKSDLRTNTLVIGLEVTPVSLKENAVKRVDKMLQQGLEKEVKSLAKRYGWEIEPMKGIGYREWRDYFEESQTLEQTKDKIISSTLKLAKKQRTWFKRNSFIQWVDDPKKAVDIVTTFLNKEQ